MEHQTSKTKPKRRGRGHPPEGAPVPTAFRVAAPAPRPAFGFLDEGGIERLRARVFDLLGGYGVVVAHRKAAATLIRAGAREGSEGGRLRFPREMVEEALAATPKSAVLCGKTPERDLPLPRADKGFVMRTGTGAHGFVDPTDGSYRNLMLDDVATMAAVANGLDEVGFIAHPFVHGVPELTADIHSLAALIQRTDKHVCSFSPLEFKVMDTEVIRLAGRYGLPVHACSLPSGGGTAPITVPGMVLMAAAEIVAMVTMAHVLAPGTPVIATPLMFTLDMRTGRSLQSCVESLQAAGMAIQMMKRGFGLLAHTYGAGSDTPDVDAQSMAERALLGQTVALAGADILGGVGQLECATVFSPVQAVLDNELGRMLRRYLQAPEIDDESLDWPEISSIRAGGHFLDSFHTLKYCRHQLLPGAFLREDRDSYEAAGRRCAVDQARDICLDLIGRPPPEGLPGADAGREMAEVVAAADRDILAADAAHTGAREEI
jgi:trimethylamine:corrinoid methyltransferase-like protein